jgi:hypothetical protein
VNFLKSKNFKGLLVLAGLGVGGYFLYKKWKEQKSKESGKPKTVAPTRVAARTVSPTVRPTVMPTLRPTIFPVRR